jgi:DNA-binding transcriptional MocR family regulator
MTYDDLVRKLRKLLPQERQALRDMLARDAQTDTAASTLPSGGDHAAPRLADGSDPQEYVNRLREAWHDRVKIHANSAR